MFFSGTPWQKIMPVDFRVILKNPHFNKLKKPLVLPREYERFMMDETIAMLETWTSFHKYGIKPWDISGRITDADIAMLQVIDQIQKDGERYQNKKQDMRQAEQEFISNRRNYGF